MSAEPGTPIAARIALWGGREAAALIVASLVAGSATTLFAAYHFHRLAPYGVLANLFAMPAVSVWVMPAGILGLIALPFGFDRPFWWLMGEGIDWMITVATWVAGLLGAVGRIPAFGVGPLLIGTAGLVLMCLLRSPLRWTGAALVALCTALAWNTPRPDILVSADAGMVAVRDANGILRVMATRRDGFALRAWLAADGDARTDQDESLAEGIRCDPAGCVAQLADGRAVALSKAAESLSEDCERAALVVTARTAPAGCAATVIDRNATRAAGAMSGRLEGSLLTWETARPGTRDRPWANRPVEAPSAPLRAAPPRDATPRPSDLEADDAPSVTPE
jgi:competence protein ComEC